MTDTDQPASITNKSLESRLRRLGSVSVQPGDRGNPEIPWDSQRSLAAIEVQEAVRGFAPASESPKPVTLRGVQVMGDLNLSRAELPSSLTFEHCRFDGALDLRGASGRSLRFDDCHFAAGLRASRLELSGHLDLTGNCVIEDGADFTSAHVRGMDLSGAHFQLRGPWDSERFALDAQRLDIEESLLCKGLVATGGIRLYDANIKRQANFQGADLRNPKGYSLDGYGLTLGGALICNNHFHSVGVIRLLDGEVAGQVTFRDAQLENPSDYTVYGSNFSIGGTLHLSDGFISNGGVFLYGCRIGGSVRASGADIRGPLNLQAARISGTLDMAGATLENPEGPTLKAPHAVIEGSAYLRRGFKALGKIDLTGISVRHQLSFAGAELTNPKGRAVEADRATVQGSLYCNRLKARGEMRLRAVTVGVESSFTGADLSNPGGTALNLAGSDLPGGLAILAPALIRGELNVQAARIGNALNLGGLRLWNPNGRALSGSRLTVEGSAFFRNGFESEGWINLRSAQVTSELSFAGAITNNKPGAAAIDLHRARIGALRLTHRMSPSGKVSLNSCTAGIFWDKPETWPQRLDLDGFTYESLGPLMPSSQRISWLEHAQPGHSFRPGLYDQLADLYRRRGGEEKAIDVAIAKQRRRRSKLPMHSRAWSRVLDVTVGYGYKSHRALAGLIALVFAGLIVFSLAHPAHFNDLDPNTTHSDFNALAFSVDAVLPVIDLGQERYWSPSGIAEYCYWTLVLGGWLLTTIMIAALTGLLKRPSS